MYVCNYCGRVLKHEYEKCPGCGGSSFKTKAYLGEEIIKTPPKDGYKLNKESHKSNVKIGKILIGVGVVFTLAAFPILITDKLFSSLFSDSEILKEMNWMDNFYLVPLVVGIMVTIFGIMRTKTAKNNMDKLENLSKKGILVKNIPYEVIMTKTVYMGSTGVKLKVIYKNSAGVDIPLYSEIKFNVEKQLSSDETVDLLIDPDDYSNYFIDFEIY